MTTRGILNLILLVGVAALVLVTIYQPGIKPPPPPILLTTLRPEQVQHVKIENTDKPTLTFEKQNGHWRIISPQALPADDGSLNAVLRLTQEVSQVRFTAKPEALRKYKLEHPAIRLTLNDLSFAFGDTDPINGRRYVQLGNTVHLITDMYYSQLDADLSAFVSTRLLPNSSSIAALTLPTVTINRDAQGRWHLQPESPQVSADAVQKLVDAWRDSNALWVKPYEKGTALGSVTARLAAPAQDLHFDIMAKQPELILARPDIGMQYHLSAESAKTLLELNSASPVKTSTDAKTHP